MSSSSGHPLNISEQQKTVYVSEDNPGPITMSNNTTCITNHEVSNEQQIVYGTAPVLYQPYRIPQAFGRAQHTANSQIVNQKSPSHIVNQQQYYQQQVPLNNNASSAYVQQAMIHSNMYPQQALVSSYHPGVNTNVLFSSSMTNPNISSTPISANTKRGRNDTSGVSESNGKERPQHYQTTRISNARNTPNKRHRGFNQQQKENWQQNQYNHGREDQITYDITAGRNIAESTYDNQQPSMAACRYATSRFPFSPFSIIFSQQAREKIVIDDLIKHANDNCLFELKTVAYRRGRSENNECRILIFVENSESFSFLYERSNWPTTLAGQEFTTKSPSIPPQLSLVIPAVSLQIDWEDFVHELKEKYPGIADVIRLKNKAQQPVRAVKLEFLSASVRNEILDANEISVMHLKLKVVEFFTHANVLICSNCYGIGHFRKQCPQKNESTCKTCGEKCVNLTDHQCSGVLKCVHCGGPHISNDAKCKVVKDYRVALTRNLLSKLDPANTENPRNGLIHSGIIPSARTTNGESYANMVKTMSSNANEVVLKKLDSVLTKVEEESNITRQSLEEFKQEIRNNYNETKQQVIVIEEKVKEMEKKIVEFSGRIDQAKTTLSSNDYCLLKDIIDEWHKAASLNLLELKWKQNQRKNVRHGYFSSSLNILCFNVRGLDLRWGEVCLLVKQHLSDIIVLGEVGRVDIALISAALSNHNVFYQCGENAHGGVLVMVRKDISAVRVSCSLPNICALDLQFDQTIRLIAMYAPESKTWNWSDLTPLVTNCCMILGDFNIYIEQDGEKADRLLEWMDSCCLGPVVPDSNTSLRSDRTIDYAVTIGVDLTIQAYEGETTSDHKPLLGVLVGDKASTDEGSRTIWPVFTLMLSYIFDYWEKKWDTETYDITYERPSIPPNLVKILAQSRSLSFKAKRKGDIELRKEAHRLRNFARFELKNFQKEQLAKQLKERHLPGEASRLFWSKTKRHFRQVSSSLRGFFSPSGEIIKDSQIMADMAADHYEGLFETPVVMRPHPYVDAPPVQWENAAEPIPMVTYPEILNILRSRKKKQSLDIHGLSPFILDKIPQNYWHLLVQLYNYSFTEG
ncbi:unnamed protein product, partial [Rotaria socialis]